jgi:hypothetical protein
MFKTHLFLLSFIILPPVANLHSESESDLGEARGVLEGMQEDVVCLQDTVKALNDVRYVCVFVCVYVCMWCRCRRTWCVCRTQYGHLTM